jgi:hypothetical protein
MDCFPCSVIKRRAELELADRGASSEEIARLVAATRCAMCSEAEQQEARRKRPRPLTTWDR